MTDFSQLRTVWVGALNEVILEAYKDNPPHYSIWEKMIPCIDSLFPYTEPSAATTMLDVARAKDAEALNLRIYEKIDRIKDAVAIMFGMFINALPLACKTTREDFLEQLDGSTSEFTIPLLDYVTPKLVSSLLFSFVRDEFPSFAYQRLHKQMIDNINNAGLPEAFKGSNKELLHAYFKHTPFLNLFDAQIPFAFDNQRFEHHHICAKSGHGKTTLYSVMLERDLERVARGEASVIVMDSQGDFLEKEVLRYKEFAPGGTLHNRLVYVDPTDIEHPFQLNVFARTKSDAPTTAREQHRQRTAIFDLFTFIFGALDQKLTGRQQTPFRAVSALMLQIPDANLSTLNDLFEPTVKKAGTNPLARFQEYIDRLDPAEQKFFNVDFHTSEFADTRSQIRARVQSLMVNPVFRNMFNAPRQALDLDHEMQRGTVLLINCNRDFLGDESEMFGRFFIALIRRAAQAREQIPMDERTPCYVYIDECQQYISNDRNLTAILETARKYKVAMLLAHQYLGQLNRVAVQPAVQGCAIKMVGQPTNDDINSFAGQLRTSKEFLQAQPIGTFATFVNGVTPTAVALKVPLGGLRDKPKMTKAELDQVIAKNRAKYCTPEPIREAATASSGAAATSTPIQEQGSNTPIVPPENAADFVLVLNTSGRIEKFLVSRYGATGQSLHKKLASIEDKLPPHLLKPVRTIATIRNKVVHENFLMSDSDRAYFHKCAQAFDDFMNAQAAPKDGKARSSTDKTSPTIPDPGEIPSDPQKRW